MNTKSLFPIFNNNPELVYLDSASTSQKPKVVIDKIIEFYSAYNSNIHRGLYKIAEQATQEYEISKQKVAELIGSNPGEIVFTSGTTDSINAVTSMLSKSGKLSDKPKILLSILEHNSNLIPWHEITNAEISYLELDEDKQILSPEDLIEVDVLAITLASNVTGTITALEDIKKKVKYKFLVVDAAQAVGHVPVDVKEIECDFLAFSAHKIFGPTGLGVLYINNRIADELLPFRYGGGMVRDMTLNKFIWAEIPEKFEAGTPPIAQAVGLSAGISFIQDMGGVTSIRNSEKILAKYANEQLLQIPELTLHRPQLSEALGVFSFTIEKIHPHDTAQILADNNICVRAGHHCTHTLHKYLNLPATTRASISIYNSEEDIDKLCMGIKKAISLLR